MTALFQRRRGAPWEEWAETSTPEPPPREALEALACGQHRFCCDWRGVHFHKILFEDGFEWTAPEGRPEHPMDGLLVKLAVADHELGDHLREAWDMVHVRMAAAGLDPEEGWTIGFRAIPGDPPEVTYLFLPTRPPAFEGGDYTFRHDLGHQLKLTRKA